MIYTHFGAQGAEYVPDGQQEVYMHFFDDLDEAVEILSDYVAERPMAGEFAKFDLLLDGSYAGMAPLRQLAAHASGRASCVSRAGEGPRGVPQGGCRPVRVSRSITNNAAVRLRESTRIRSARSTGAGTRPS